MGDWSPVLATKDAKSIDEKIDDGQGNTGIVFGGNTLINPNCFNAGNYDLSRNDVVCVLRFDIK